MSASRKRHEPVLFAWGDVFGGGAQALVSVIYLIFLTDVIGCFKGMGCGRSWV
jgi:Na+/melibiose symporter-like transporter